MIEILKLIAGVFGPLFLAGWVLRPLDRSARYYRANGRFMMVDFLGLVFLVQLPIALISNLNSGGDKNDIAPVYVLLPLVSALVWWTAVATFAKAGVKEVRTRMILVFAVLPVSYFGSIVAITLFVLSATTDRHSIRYLSFAGVILFGMLLSGRYTRSIERQLKLQIGARENPVT